MKVSDFHPDAGRVDQYLRQTYPQLVFTPDRGVARGDLVRRVTTTGHGLGTLQVIGWDRSGQSYVTPLPMDGSDLGFHVSRDPHVPMDGSGTWYWFPEVEGAVGWLLEGGG